MVLDAGRIVSVDILRSHHLAGSPSCHSGRVRQAERAAAAPERQVARARRRERRQGEVVRDGEGGVESCISCVAWRCTHMARELACVHVAHRIIHC